MRGPAAKRHLLVLPLVLTLGCRALLGIDQDRDLVDVPPVTSGNEAGLKDDAAAGPAAVDGAPSSFDAAVVAVDRRYAVWPLPPSQPLLSNYVLTSETVTDKTTGLVWQRNDVEPYRTLAYPLGATHCKDLSLAGQTDWRLPTRIELLSILDYAQPAGLLNASVFPGGAPPGAQNAAWTESVSLLRSNLDDRLVVDLFDDGVHIAADANLSLVIKCVRGGPATSPVSRYDIDAGTARDVRTGLVWQVTPPPATMTWDAALGSCAALTLGGATGFRLPTARELASLIDEAREMTPLLPPQLQAGPGSRFWTSTTRVKRNTDPLIVDFDTASLFTVAASEPQSVRCVR